MHLIYPLNTLSYKIGRQPLIQNSYTSTNIKIFIAFASLTHQYSDGHQYIASIKNKCFGLIIENPTYTLKKNLPIWISFCTRLTLALLVEDFFNYPSHNVRIWGISGTKGKTTSSFLLSSICQALNLKVGLIGTLGYGTLQKLNPLFYTTPDAESLSRILSLLKFKQFSDITLEISSHALVSFRIHGLSLYSVCLLNFDHDHLDFHKHIFKYMNAKKILFKYFSSCNLPVIQNSSLLSFFSPSKSLSFGFSKFVNFYPSKISNSNTGTSFELNAFNKKMKISSQTLGKFNIENVLCVSGMLLASGFHLHHISMLSKTASPLGRLEKIYTHPAIFVDFAHSPNSLKFTLLSLHRCFKRKIILIFGCGGNRDKNKRKLMTSIASKYANISIITMDNPRGEAPHKIFKDMNIPQSSIKIKNRQLAISYAINAASNNDIILIAGKGHEKIQHIKNKQIICNDARIAYVNVLDRY
ncbi:MAG: UDP-N-acetylmuramyl-tripeptide synthetase [Deltaproteobacteria bacterium]|nr:MAG: UDP-N-acetylmuramyl-tripeptide synthetase [Deltaproteobacteria bacterium]